jgi:hypothetical protein
MVQYVNMTIQFDEGVDPCETLKEAFGASRPRTKRTRSFWLEQHLTQAKIDYAAEWNEGLILGCTRNSPTVQLAFEPVPNSDVRRSCETLWKLLLATSGGSKLQLERLELRRAGVTLPSDTARTGIGAAMKAREVRFLLATAAITALILFVMVVLNLAEAQTPEVLVGAAPALIAGAAALLLAASEARGQRLVWEI